MSDYHIGVLAGLDAALLKLLPRVDSAATMVAALEILKVRRELMEQVGPKLARLLAEASARTGVGY